MNSPFKDNQSYFCFALRAGDTRWATVACLKRLTAATSVGGIGVGKLKAFSEMALNKGYTVIGLTASGTDEKQQFKTKHKLNFDFYLCDEKALKTVVRASPGIVKLKKGTVQQKVHWNDIDDIDF